MRDFNVGRRPAEIASERTSTDEVRITATGREYALPTGRLRAAEFQ